MGGSASRGRGLTALFAGPSGTGQRKKRAETLRLRAPALGLEFLGDAPDADAAAAELGPFAFLMRGVRRYIENRLRGSRDGYDLVLFDYGYTASSDSRWSARANASSCSPTGWRVTGWNWPGANAYASAWRPGRCPW